MNLGEKVLGGSPFKKSEKGPACRLSTVGLLITYIGLALCGPTLTPAIILNLAGHQALAQQLATLTLYPFALVPPGDRSWPNTFLFIYKNVDPLATP